MYIYIYIFIIFLFILSFFIIIIILFFYRPLFYFFQDNFDQMSRTTNKMALTNANFRVKRHTRGKTHKTYKKRPNKYDLIPSSKSRPSVAGRQQAWFKNAGLVLGVFLTRVSSCVLGCCPQLVSSLIIIWFVPVGLCEPVGAAAARRPPPVRGSFLDHVPAVCQGVLSPVCSCDSQVM